MTRMVKNIRRAIPRVAIADASGLIYSDDYRQGWTNGFRSIGADVRVFDIGLLAKMPRQRSGPYSIGSSARHAAMVAKNMVAWDPDLVWCHHGRAAGMEGFLGEFKKRGIRTAVYLCDEPYESGETVKYSPMFDFVFTMDPCTIHLHALARRNREVVFYLPPAAETDHFKYVGYEQRESLEGKGIHIAPVMFLGNASLKPREDYLRPVENAIAGAEIRYWKATMKGKEGWVPLQDHPKLYSRCMVGLNVHRSPWMDEKCLKTRVKSGRSTTPSFPGLAPNRNPAEFGTGFWNDYNLPAAHVNPRFFEMSACGTLVVNDDHRTELARMFPWAPRASSPERFLELVLHYLDRPEEAAKIGYRCHQEILRRHTYRHRAAEILHRTGLRMPTRGSGSMSSEVLQDCLTTQDFDQLGVHQSSEPTGHYDTYDPRIGLALTQEYGSPKSDGSLRMDYPWSR